MSWYARFEFDAEQMNEIRLGLEKGVDVCKSCKRKSKIKNLNKKKRCKSQCKKSLIHCK